MHIARYYQRVRLWNPTGVGKHIGNMTSRLSQALGGLQHIHASDDYMAAQKLDVPDVSVPDTLCRLPAPRRVLEAGWMLAGWPPVERWSGESDWVYCPAEYYVAARRSRLAVTIHCDNWFNEELPWYRNRDTVQTRRRRRRLYATIAEKADMVFCVSEFLRERMVNHFNVAEARTAVVGNGVEEAFFEPQPVCHAVADRIAGRPYVCIIGGVTRRKGGDATVAIMKRAAEARKDMLFVVVGSSEAQFQGELSNLPNVFQTGYLGVSDGLTGLVADAVAVLFLSRYETFGIPAIEAMAAGTVPIVSAYGALPEVVGKEGVIVRETQYCDVVDILCGMSTNPPDSRHRDALRTRARDFTWDKCAERVLLTLA